jgi:hypothetical protein
MAPVSKPSSFRRFAFGIFGVVSVLLGTDSVPASAGVKGGALGISLPRPMGDQTQTFNRPIGYQAEVWLDSVAPLPHNTQFRFSATYQPYRLNTFPDGRLHLVGVFGGLQVTTLPSAFGISPFFSAEIGGVYESLNFDNVSSNITNNTLRFAVQGVPGFDFPIYSHLGGLVEMPVMVVFQSSTLVVWNGSFSLRWKL